MDEGVKAYFTVSFKEIVLDPEVSKSRAKRLDGISREPDSIRAFLLGQVGKHDNCGTEINLGALLDYAYQVFAEAQTLIGGRVILLECEDSAGLVTHYERHGFERLQSNGLLQMVRIFDGVTHDS